MKALGAIPVGFGVKVANEAVRHSHSQGGVERFDRTLLTMLRKKLRTR